MDSEADVPAHKKQRDSIARTNVSQNSLLLQPSDMIDGCHSTDLTVSKIKGKRKSAM